MFKTKRDVDRHVSHILNRIREEKERNSRGYQFAKLYYDVGDYESSKRYLQAFLSVREAVPQAHKLMGQIYDALRDKNKAIEAFKRSLDLEPNQNDVVLKVCELYCDPSVKVDADQAQFWIEKAEKYHPENNIIFKLKERVIDKTGDGDSGEMEHLISTELLKNPTDVQLHIKLMRLFIQSRDVDRAYDHAVKTMKMLAFVSSIDWYECLSDVYQVYQDQHGCGDDTIFYTYKLFALSTLTFLRLKAEDRDMLSAVKAISQLDQDIYEASGMRKQSSEWDNFLTEMKGQLFFLMAIFLLKRALKGQVPWKDASTFSAVCFLISDSFPTVDQKSSWYCQVSPDRRKFYDHLYMSGCDRLSQGGHMIYSVINKQDDGLWARKLRQKMCTPQGKEALYSLIFTSGDLRRRKESSYILQSDVFTGTSLDVPAKRQLVEYDSAAYGFHCGNLGHLVWLALQHHSLKDDIQPDYEQLFGYQIFPDMRYSVKDLQGGDPSSLSQLDVQVFLYACVRWSAENQRDRKRNLHAIADKPDLLPACLSSNQCTKAQCEWWSAVYRMENKQGSEKLSKLWGVVMRGLETIRMVNPHTLPLPLTVHIAKTLDARAKEIECLDAEGIVTPKLASVHDRAAYYWKMASDVLDRIDRNQSIKLPKEMLFPSDRMIDPAFTKKLQEHVKFAMATVAMRKENYEEALKAFENLDQPEASYYKGLIYRKLGETVDVNGNSSGSSQNSQQMTFLSKSKDALYQALDRLERDQNEELKECVRRDLDDVVCKLISLESGGILMDSIVSNNSENFSMAKSDSESDEEPIKQPSPRTPLLPTPSKSREILRASPTRLEFQLKALESCNSALSSRLGTLEETVRTNEKLIQELFTQLRESRDENRTLRDQMQILSFQGLSSMSMARPYVPQSFPGTPQATRNMMNPMNSSFGAGVPFEYPGQGGIPQHMSQYGYTGGSPRPGSAFGQHNYEDDFHNVDGEYYDPDAEGECYIPDQSLVQEWPFGHKAGVEGKSTITYSPQHQGRATNQVPVNPAGVYANALRGQSIQYGGFQQPGVAPPQPMAPQMPGPGFFSQNNQNMQPPVLQSQSGAFQGQSQLGVKSNSSPAMSSAMQQKAATPTQSISGKPTTPMMPPNAIASQSTEVKPTLIQGSVGVPTPKKDEKAVSTQSASSAQTGLLSTPSAMPSVATANSTSTILHSKANSTTGQSQPTPASAASMLSQLAAKHQDDKQGQVPVSQSTPQKTVFQGFSFTSTPKISEPKAESKTQVDKPIPNTTTAAPAKPFSGFSFTTPTQSPATTKPMALFGTPSQAQPSPGAPPFMMGQNSGSALSFGNLATQGQTAAAFQAGGDSKGFMGVGQPLFGKSPSPRRRNVSTGSDDHIEEYEPNVDFKPVVPLPDLIEVKTGEEEEEKLFCERAKLFRFDKESNQWKERGIGEMKILRHQQSKKVRILMRREQVLKLCANHTLTEDMKLTPMSSSDKAWVWNAMDFAEEEMKYEKFAIKLKNADVAQKFKDVFEKCQAEITDQSHNDEKTEKSVTDAKPDSGAQADKGDFSALFKQKPGSWTCEGCYIQNNGDVLKCPCCCTLKPGVKAEDIKTTAPAVISNSSGSGFKFGTQSSDQSGSQDGSGFKFGSQPTNSDSGTTSGSGFKFGSTAASQPSFPFGTKPADLTTTTNAPSSSGLGFKFAANTATTTTTQSGGFKFGSMSTVTSSISAAATSTTSEDTELDIPEPCKPTSGFTFGGGPAQTSDSTKAASSAGFNVNADNSKFSFGTPSKDSLVVSEVSAAKDVKPKSDVSQSILAKFLSSPDSWKCDGCFVNNDGDLDKCPCCNAKKPTEKSDDKKGSEVASTVFGTSTKSDFKFGSGAVIGTGSNETKSAFTSSSEDASKSSGFSFGTPSKSASEGFKFSLNPADTQKQQPPASLGSGFNFSLSMTPTVKSPTAQSTAITSPKSPEVNEDGYYVGDDGSHIHFEPVIDLPEKVEVKTGEEDEDVLFSHRAKLYRFDNGEWKERGLGDVKVLFHTESKKARIVMRREQIFKLCCNHYVVPELSLNQMPNSKGCALVWFAMDCADGEAKSEKLSIKFKTAEIATEFEAAVEDAKTRISGNPQASVSQSLKASNAAVETIGASSNIATEDAADADVIFVSKETATEEEIKQARALMLPDHFYLYKRRPSCPGCRGCDDRLSEDTGDEEENGQDYEEEQDDDDYDEEDDDYEDVDDDGDETDDEKNEVIEETFRSQMGISTGGTGNPQYSKELDKDEKNEVIEETFRSQMGISTGGTGNPQYSKELDKDEKNEVIEETFRSQMGISTGGTGNPQYSKELDKDEKNEVIEETFRSQMGISTGGTGNPQYSKELDKDEKNEVIEETFRSQMGISTGGTGNPQYSKELDKDEKNEVIEETFRSQMGISTGGTGNPQYSKELDKDEDSDTQLPSQHRQNGTFFLSQLLSSDEKNEVIEETFRSQMGISTGGMGNPQYSKELDKAGEDGQSSGGSGFVFGAGTSGEFSFSSLAQSSTTQVFKTDEKNEVIEETFRSQMGISTGGTGNPQYSKELDKAGEDGQSSGGSGFVFGAGTSGEFSFSSLAQSSTTQVFKTDESKPFSWHGAGKQLFGAGSSAADDNGEEGDVQQGEDQHFEPVVPLPDLVDVKTGEEEEVAQFSNRAKLFRFDKTADQWKEKGIGEMKILKHKETGKYRLLLRREQVHKLACNHLLTPDLTLTPMNTSETSWCWIAQDFSDNEPKIEKLAVKFKTIELAKTFKDKFEEIQAELKSQGENEENVRGGNSSTSDMPVLSELLSRDSHNDE